MYCGRLVSCTGGVGEFRVGGEGKGELSTVDGCTGEFGTTF